MQEIMTVGFRKYRTVSEILEVEVAWIKEKGDVATNRTELYGFLKPSTEKKSLPQEFMTIVLPEPLHRKWQQLLPHFLSTH